MTKQPCGGVEDFVADTIEIVMPREGFTPQSRECHDAQTGRLRVDFVYHAEPHDFALEITTLTDPTHRAGVTASTGLMERLSRAASSDGLGSWFVAVSTEHASMKELEPEILKIIRDAQPNAARMLLDGSDVWSGYYTSSDLQRLPQKEVRPFIREHQRIRDLGIRSVRPMPTDVEPVVLVIPTTDVKAMHSFTDGLSAAITANKQKLEDSELPQHLAVLVDRIDASPTPSVTAVPLPHGLERLWILHPWGRSPSSVGVWVASEGDAAWRVY